MNKIDKTLLLSVDEDRHLNRSQKKFSNTTSVLTTSNKFSSSNAATALSLRAETTLRKEEQLSKFNFITDLVESDDEADSPCPIFDQFYSQGRTSAINNLTNFEARDFEQIWPSVSEYVKITLRVAGKRAKWVGRIQLSCFLQLWCASDTETISAEYLKHVYLLLIGRWLAFFCSCWTTRILCLLLTPLKIFLCMSCTTSYKHFLAFRKHTMQLMLRFNKLLTRVLRSREENSTSQVIFICTTLRLKLQFCQNGLAVSTSKR